MEASKRPLAFWIISLFLLLTTILLLVGQTLALFNYELAVSLGLQEDVAEIGDFGVQMNRAFGAGDTVIYLPLTIASLLGLFQRKPWAVITSAGMMGISAYWASTVIFLLVFLEGVPGYRFVPAMDYWITLSLYIVVGIWGLWYLAFRGEELVHE